MPNDDQHRRGANDLRKPDQSLVFNLSAFERARQPRADGREHARQYFAIIELGERRKPRALGNDQAHHFFALGAVDFTHENLDRLIDNRAQRQVAL